MWNRRPNSAKKQMTYYTTWNSPGLISFLLKAYLGLIYKTNVKEIKSNFSYFVSMYDMLASVCSTKKAYSDAFAFQAFHHAVS